MPESLIIGEVDLMSERASKAPRPNGVDFSSTVVVAGIPEEPSHSPGQGPSSYRPARDSTWLQVDVCRDYQRDTCPRGYSCRFAHLRSGVVVVKDGKVTCCYDYLKDRCQRPQCKYYHPPVHIKEKLVCAGKQFGAMMSTASSLLPPAGMVTTTMAPYNTESVSTAMYTPDTVAAPASGYHDVIPICPDFLVGYCSLVMCSFAHPGPHVRHNSDYTVTVCQNFMKYGCSRGEGCRFYHPLSHQLWGAVLPFNGGAYKLGQAVPPGYNPYLTAVPPPTPVPVMLPMTPFPYAGMPTSPMVQMASSGFVPLPVNGGVMSLPYPPISLPHIPSTQPYLPPMQPAAVNGMENSDAVLESEE